MEGVPLVAGISVGCAGDSPREIGFSGSLQRGLVWDDGDGNSVCTEGNDLRDWSGSDSVSGVPDSAGTVPDRPYAAVGVD